MVSNIYDVAGIVDCQYMNLQIGNGLQMDGVRQDFRHIDYAHDSLKDYQHFEITTWRIETAGKPERLKKWVVRGGTNTSSD